MSAAASDPDRLAALLAQGAERGAQALAGLAGAGGGARRLLRPEPAALRAVETGVAFDFGGALEGAVVVLFPEPARERLLAALGARAQQDPGSALCEVANIVASQTVSAIADALGSRLALSLPRLALRGSGAALAAALDAGAAALACEIGPGRAGARALLALLPGAAPRSALP